MTCNVLARTAAVPRHRHMPTAAHFDPRRERRPFLARKHKTQNEQMEKAEGGRKEVHYTFNTIKIQTCSVFRAAASGWSQLQWLSTARISPSGRAFLFRYFSRVDSRLTAVPVDSSSSSSCYRQEGLIGTYEKCLSYREIWKQYCDSFQTPIAIRDLAFFPAINDHN